MLEPLRSRYDRFDDVQVGNRFAVYLREIAQTGVAVRAIVLQINEYTPELASMHMARVPAGPRVITPRLEATSVGVAVVEAKAAAESAGESAYPSIPDIAVMFRRVGSGPEADLAPC
jgi:hypothetical protein